MKRKFLSLKLFLLAFVLACSSVSALASPISSHLSLLAGASCTGQPNTNGATVSQGATTSPLNVSVAASDNVGACTIQSFAMGSVVWLNLFQGVVKFHYGWDYVAHDGVVEVGPEFAPAFEFAFDSNGGNILVNYDVVFDGQGPTGQIGSSTGGPATLMIHPTTSGFNHFVGTFMQPAVDFHPGPEPDYLHINAVSNVSGCLACSSPGHLDVQATFTFTVPGASAVPEPASLPLTCTGVLLLLFLRKAAARKKLNA